MGAKKLWQLVDTTIVTECEEHVEHALYLEGLGMQNFAKSFQFIFTR